mgnify:CR=1 FL=1
MNPILRQRLVGTLVLVALGIVFWPLIFVTPDQRDPISVQPMADKPDIDRSPIAAPETYELAVAEKLPAPNKLPEEEQMAADAETLIDAEKINLVDLPRRADLESALVRNAPPAGGPLIDDEGLPVFWVLQVATVGGDARATELVAGLTDRGYTAFSTPYVRVDEELFRVQIGPNAERQKLLLIKPEVDSVLGVDSQVLRYVQ